MDTYKEKYNEALERARKLKENPQSVFNEYSPKEGDTICDYIFPELRESEDERIREQIIYAINKLNVPESEKSKLLAWLEKQGEKKPQRIISAEAKEALLNESEREALRTEYEKGRADAIAEIQKEWSEEDEKMMNSFLHKVEVCNLLTNKENVWFINKLKSLKQRIAP